MGESCSAGDRDEAALLRFLGPPEFMAVDAALQPAVLAVVEDAHGRPWAFIDMTALLPDRLFTVGRAARVEPIDGDGLSIAIRAEYRGHDPARWCMAPGDARVMRRDAWIAAHPGRLGEPWVTSRRCDLAVELPHRAARYALVGR